MTFAVVALAAFVTAANAAIAVESLAPVPMLDASHLTTEVVALCLRSQETAAEAEVKYVERELDTVVAAVEIVVVVHFHQRQPVVASASVVVVLFPFLFFA